MEAGKPESPKPKRLYYKTYLQLLHNAVGTQMFRNFYVELPDGRELDAMSDGSNSCAFFVSSVLTLFKKLDSPHGTVKSTVEDLQRSGWQPVAIDDITAGDVLVWEAQTFEDGSYEHIGFYLGGDQAVSTSWRTKKVVEHHVTFDDTRNIVQAFNHSGWDR